MPSVLEEAISDLQNVKHTWERIISDLSLDPNRQLSPEEAKSIRVSFDLERRRIQYTFAWPDQTNQYLLEFNRFVSEIETRLDIAIMAGQRRYDDEMHRRKMERIKTWGKFLSDIKFNVVAFVLGIISAVIYIFFPR
ncbi:MAG: hypothetical protein Q7V05_06860 [Methanoregula sp.]|nr:hypothetical protein [Methanoregula sp.]